MTNDSVKQFDNDQLKQRLTDIQYAVTQRKHTEPWVQPDTPHSLVVIGLQLLIYYQWVASLFFGYTFSNSV